MDPEMIAYFDSHFRENARQFAELRQQISGVEQQLTAFREETGQRFEQVDRRFEQVDRRFEQVDQRFEQVDQRFEQVETTCRHTLVLVEGLRDQLRAVAEGFLTVNERLEVEIKKSEVFFEDLPGLVGPYFRAGRPRQGLGHLRQGLGYLRQGCGYPCPGRGEPGRSPEHGCLPGDSQDPGPTSSSRAGRLRGLTAAPRPSPTPQSPPPPPPKRSPASGRRRAGSFLPPPGSRGRASGLWRLGRRPGDLLSGYKNSAGEYQFVAFRRAFS
jgi:hypothetical protein